METHKYKENPLSPGNCIACGLNEYSWHHSKTPESNFVKGMRIADEAAKKFHSEAPENKSIVSLEGWESVKLSLEAPSGQFGKETLSSEFVGEILSKAPRLLNEKNINYFEIPKKEKELDWQAPTDESWDEKRDIYKMGFEVGKSEAFSLVRKMVHDSEDLRDPKTQIYKIINAHDFLSRLSTLEGK